MSLCASALLSFGLIWFVAGVLHAVSDHAWDPTVNNTSFKKVFLQMLYLISPYIRLTIASSCAALDAGGRPDW